MELRLAMPVPRIAIAPSIFSRRAMLAKGAAQRAGAERLGKNERKICQPPFDAL